jgi:outer membrane protein, heavy metal efflux system
LKINFFRNYIRKFTHLVILSFIFFPLLLLADEGGAESCSGKISILKVVECVLEHSPEYKLEKQELGVVAGRKLVNAYLFPSNPVFSFTQALRRGNENPGTYLNGEILISQEVFLSPIRRAKLQSSEMEKLAQYSKIETVYRNTIAEAVKASIRYTISEAILEEAKKLYQSTLDLSKTIEERVKQGLLPPIDLDISESEKIKIFKILQVAKRNRDRTKADLTVMMGIPFQNKLEILSIPVGLKKKDLSIIELTQKALKTRPEIFLAERNIKYLQKRTEILKLERIPNLTIAGFIQRDGYNENVLGARFIFPMQVWRNNRGEMVENHSRIQQSHSLLEVQIHTIKQEVIQAVTDFQSLDEEMQVYTDSSLKRTRESLEALQKAIKMGQMNPRESLLIQQSLMGYLLSFLDTKREWMLAGIEILRASGHSIVELEHEL